MGICWMDIPITELRLRMRFADKLKKKTVNNVNLGFGKKPGGLAMRYIIFAAVVSITLCSCVSVRTIHIDSPDYKNEEISNRSEGKSAQITFVDGSKVWGRNIRFEDGMVCWTQRKTPDPVSQPFSMINQFRFDYLGKAAIKGFAMGSLVGLAIVATEDDHPYVDTTTWVAFAFPMFGIIGSFLGIVIGDHVIYRVRTNPDVFNFSHSTHKQGMELPLGDECGHETLPTDAKSENDSTSSSPNL